MRHEIRVPRPAVEISPQDGAIFHGSAVQYKINMVQPTVDVWPASLDLELVQVLQTLPLAEGGEDDG